MDSAHELTNRLGMNLASLAELVEEKRPLIVDQDGRTLREPGLDRLFDGFGDTGTPSVCLSLFTHGTVLMPM
jgi:hypothetical protein